MEMPNVITKPKSASAARFACESYIVLLFLHIYYYSLGTLPCVMGAVTSVRVLQQTSRLYDGKLSTRQAK